MQYPLNPLSESFPDIIGPSLPQKYRPRRSVGRGACSTVWTLIDNATEQIVVGKLSDLSRMDEQGRNFARSEAANIARCEHPNIIQLIGTYESREKLLHILEYADAGDLMYQLQARANRFSPVTNASEHVNGTSARGERCYYKEKEILVIVAQLCLAIRYLHERKIMHRDLKSANVFVTQSGLIKLGDFGFSRQYNQGFSVDVGSTFCGTPYYLPPELWRREKYGYKADIWSLGVVLYELMALQKPFPATDMVGLMQRVLKEGSYDPLPVDLYSKDLCDLCYGMLRVNPQERLSIMEVLTAPIVLKEGLEYLRVNVPRLRGIDQSVRERLLWEVESVHRMCSTGPPSKGLIANACVPVEQQPTNDKESPVKKVVEEP